MPSELAPSAWAPARLQPDGVVDAVRPLPVPVESVANPARASWSAPTGLTPAAVADCPVAPVPDTVALSLSAALGRPRNSVTAPPAMTVPEERLHVNVTAVSPAGGLASVYTPTHGDDPDPPVARAVQPGDGVIVAVDPEGLCTATTAVSTLPAATGAKLKARFCRPDPTAVDWLYCTGLGPGAGGWVVRAQVSLSGDAPMEGHHPKAMALASAGL